MADDPYIGAGQQDMVILPEEMALLEPHEQNMLQFFGYMLSFPGANEPVQRAVNRLYSNSFEKELDEDGHPKMRPEPINPTVEISAPEAMLLLAKMSVDDLLRKISEAKDAGKEPEPFVHEVPKPNISEVTDAMWAMLRTDQQKAFRRWMDFTNVGRNGELATKATDALFEATTKEDEEIGRVPNDDPEAVILPGDQAQALVAMITLSSLFQKMNGVV